MSDTQTNEWLSRLQESGPTYAALVLAALIVVEVARIAISMLSTPVKSPAAVPTRAVAAHNRSSVDIQPVVSAHLFGVAAPAAQDPANAPLTSANLMLAGTIASQDPAHGIAIISDGGAPSKVYAVGDHINGATLHSVYLDHVILDRTGVLETLRLPRLLTGSRALQPARRPPDGRGDPRTAAAVDNIRRMVQQDPGILDQVMRTVPSYDNAAGKLRGFRVYPGKNRAVFGKLGLKGGDLVTAVNGAMLDDPQRSQEVLNTVQTSDHVTVTIERGGQKQDITLNIAQVAAEASKDLEADSASSAAPSSASGSGSGSQGTAGQGSAPQGTAPQGSPPQGTADGAEPRSKAGVSSERQQAFNT